MGGWTGEGKDTIIWDGTIKSKQAIFSTNVYTPAIILTKIYPPADSTIAMQILKADGTTPVLNVDTRNSRIGIGTTSPSEKLEVNGTIKGTGYKSSDGTAGATGNQVIVTDVAVDGDGHVTGITTKTITYKNGLITDIS